MDQETFFKKGIDAGLSDEQIKAGWSELSKPTIDGGFNKNAAELSTEDVYGSNGAYLNSRYGNVSVDQHQSMNATHTGIDDISEEGAYGIYQGVANTKGEAIDVVDVMNRWTKRGKYAEVGDPLGDLTSTPMTPGRRFRNWFKTNLAVRRDIVGQTAEVLFEEGGAANAFSLVDFWPSKYRGLKELVGLEDFNIPVIDDIARTTKGLKLGQQERQEEFLGYLKENGYLAEVATIKSLSAVNETLIFLNEIKRLGMSYGGGGGNLTKSKAILSKLKHAQKISLFMALTQEDATFEDRLGVWKVSSLYMSTPAASGLFKNPAITKSFDFALNSLISNYKEGGYRDIIANEEMDGFDKIMAISELAGADVVFSALTRTFKSEAQPFINEANRIDSLVKEGMRPMPMSDIQAEKLEASSAGKGFVNVDRAEAEVKADLEATREQLEADINKIVADEAKEITTPEGRPVTVTSGKEVSPEKPAEAGQPKPDQQPVSTEKVAPADAEGAKEVVGKPPLYHGTKEDFTNFKESLNPKEGEMFSFGFHFTENKDFAKRYGDRIVEAELDVKNPLDVERMVTKDSELGQWLSQLNPETIWFPLDGKDAVWLKNALDAIPPQKIKKALIDAGYDGLIYNAKFQEADVGGFRTLDEGKTTIALYDSQIKQSKPATIKPDQQPVSAEKVAPADAEGALDVSRAPLENKEIEKVVKQAVAETIKENAGKSADEQAQAVKVRVEQLGEVLDAPKGTKVKTLVNRINNIRQKKPAYDISRKEYYQELQRVTKVAAESSVGEVAKITQRAHDLIDMSFPYRRGNQIKERIQKLAEKGVTARGFAERVDDILDRAYTAKQGIESVVGIKDLSKQVDMSEAEMLRSVMKASQRAATGSRRDVVDKIVSSQKKAQSILDDMPKEVRAKMISSMRSIASAKSDDARDVALNKFSSYADRVIREFERSVAKRDLKDAERSANKLVKTGKVSDQIADGITSITKGLESGRIIDGLDSVIDKATSFEEVSVASNIKQMLDGFEPKPLSQMDVAEIRQMTDALNGLVHQMNRITKEIKLHGRTQAKNRVVKVKSNINNKTPIKGEGVAGDIKEATRKWNFDVIQIPRSISENLDYYNEKGVFTEFQTRLEQSLSDTYRVEREVSNILSPHEKYMDKNGYAKNKNEKPFKVTNLKGAEVSKNLGVADRLRIYLASKDSGTWEAGMEFGWKRKYGEDTFKLTEQQAKDLFDQMPQAEKDVGDSFVEAYKSLGKYMDERSMSLNGYRLSIDDYMGPRLRVGTKSDMKASNFEMTIDLDKGQGFNEQFHRVTAESSGRFKQRTGSKAPLLVYNPAITIKGVERIVANYYGRGEVLRDINEFMYESRRGGDQSLRDRYSKLGKEGTYNTFSTYVKHLNEGRGGGYKSEADRLIERFTNAGIQYMSGKALKYNPKIVLSQAASMPTAGAVMDAKYFKIAEKAFVKGGASIEEMAKRSAFLWARYRGRVGIMIGDKALSDRQQRGLGAMKGMDSKVIGAIYRGMEAKVSDSKPGLRGEAYDRAVENEVIDVVMKSQPSFEDVSRPELARSTNPLAKMAMVFSSQRNKNLYLGTKALAGTMQKYSDGTLRPEDVKVAKRVIKQLAIANAVFASINTGMQQLIEEILDARGVKKKEYTNEDWEDEALDVAGDYVANYLTAGLSSGGAWASMIASLIQGFDAERTPMTTVIQDAKKFSSIAGDLQEIGKGFDDGDPDSVFKENWQKYGSHLATSGNIIVQPLTGVNIANLYKYLVEAPVAVMTREERMEDYRMENPDWYFED